ncbi:MAG: hypothetical protein MUE85_03190 [Microscillaceae bacterium]|jgi:hypothetical protein|nr:hypothetical protein [Microscillaceae bacterium]
MDITFIIVFVIVNLLPPNAKQCTIAAEGYQDTITLKRLQKNNWEIQLPGSTQKRYKVEALNITEILSENDQKTDMRQFFDLKTAADWQTIKKQTRQLNIKTENSSTQDPPVVLEANKNGFTLKQAGENAWFKTLKVVY